MRLSDDFHETVSHACLCKANRYALLKEGIEVLETITEPNDKLLRLINLGKYLYRTCLTTLHVKQLYVAKHRLLVADNEEAAAGYVDEIQKILLSEKENVEATIAHVQVDSRLGWEPSMQYVGDEKCLRTGFIKERRQEEEKRCGMGLRVRSFCSGSVRRP